MPEFRGVTQRQAMPHPFWGRYGTDVGVTVMRRNGAWVRRPVPTTEELMAAEGEGVDYFLGGRSYRITPEQSVELRAAGFETWLLNGEYGFGPYGRNFYGTGE